MKKFIELLQKFYGTEDDREIFWILLHESCTDYRNERDCNSCSNEKDSGSCSSWHCPRLDKIFSVD